MSITFRIDAEEGTVYSIVEGSPSTDEVVDALRTLLRSPGYRPGLRGVVDLRGSELDADAAEVRTITEFLRYGGVVEVAMLTDTRLPARSPDSLYGDGAITWGWLRGILGSLAGFAAVLLALAVVQAAVFGRTGAHATHSAGTGVVVLLAYGLVALLPGACSGVAISWQCRCSPWRRVLAAVGPGLSSGLALGLAFLALIGQQAHADWGGYLTGSGVVFALAGALAAICLAPALRLGSVRAAFALVLSGAAAFMVGGVAHGAILSAAMSGSGPGSMLAVPVGFAMALTWGWGGLGAAAESIQARSRRHQEAGRGARASA